MADKFNSMPAHVAKEIDRYLINVYVCDDIYGSAFPRRYSSDQIQQIFDEQEKRENPEKRQP